MWFYLGVLLLTLIAVFVIGCVGGCDDILKELMELSRFGSRSQAATPGFC